MEIVWLDQGRSDKMLRVCLSSRVALFIAILTITHIISDIAFTSRMSWLIIALH